MTNYPGNQLPNRPMPPAQQPYPSPRPPADQGRKSETGIVLITVVITLLGVAVLALVGIFIWVFVAPAPDKAVPAEPVASQSSAAAEKTGVSGEVNPAKPTSQAPTTSAPPPPPTTQAPPPTTQAPPNTQAPPTTQAPPPPTTTAPNPNAWPPAGTANCDGADYLWVSPNTSCPFAWTVFDAYGIGKDGTYDLESPVTGKKYTVTCATKDNRVTCTGGTNIGVYFEF